MNRPLVYCAQPGCPMLVPRGRCRTHAVQLEHARPNYAIRRWYRTPQWRALRRQVILDAVSTCARCDQVTRTLDVDHILDHAGDPSRFWDRTNLQALCSTCHARKTRRTQSRGIRPDPPRSVDAHPGGEAKG